MHRYTVVVLMALQESYNMAHEMERKRALSSLFSQTKQQEKKDAEVLISFLHFLLHFSMLTQSGSFECLINTLYPVSVILI